MKLNNPIQSSVYQSFYGLGLHATVIEEGSNVEQSASKKIYVRYFYGDRPSNLEVSSITQRYFKYGIPIIAKVT